MQSTRTHPKQAATPPNMKGPAPGAGKSKENMEITSKAKEIFRRVRRVATVIVAIGLILSLSLTVFSSCASNKVTQAKLETVHSDTFVGDFAKNLSNRPVARQYFTAALNGYDMLADGFNDADLEAMRKDEKYYKPGENGVNMDAVRKVLLEKEADWHVRPTDAGEGYEKIVSGLTEQNAKDIGERMVTAIDLTNSGFMDTILRGIGVALKWISDHLAFHSYLFALFIFALALEIVMLPFGIRQQKNTIKQAKLRPKEMAIRNKYKGRNDQATLQKMQAEIQELYQKENYNQFSSCLPLLLQLPIIFVLYYIVIDPLHYMMWLSTGTSQALTTFATTARAAGGWGISLAANNRGTVEVFSHINAEFLDAFRNFSYYSNAGEAVASLNIADLPSFNIGSVNFGLVPWFREPYALLAVPVLTFVAYFGSMKLTRKFTYQPPSAQDQQAGCSNNIMDIGMPLFSVWIACTVPAVVGVYWIFKSILSTVKQFILARLMPVPVFTEEDYKQAAKEMGGKGPKPVKKYNGATGNPRVRSLHHIDDEDFEDTKEKAERRRQAEEELEDYERPVAPKAPTSTKEEIAAARLKMGRQEEARKRHEEDESGDKREKDKKSAKSGDPKKADGADADTAEKTVEKSDEQPKETSDAEKSDKE